MPDHEFSAGELRASETYRLMTSLITPRPIAWVSTLSLAGVPNLAPFSYFQGVCSNPPTIVLGIAYNRDGSPKDTLRNILDRQEFVVNHVSRGLCEAMNQTSAAYPPEVSEWPDAGVSQVASTKVAVPRVGEAHASLECRLKHVVPLGEGPSGMPSSALVVAEVIHFRVAEGLVTRDDRGRVLPIDPGALKAVGRLGGIAYTTTDGVFELPRPANPTPPKEPTTSE